MSNPQSLQDLLYVSFSKVNLHEDAADLLSILLCNGFIKLVIQSAYVEPLIHRHSCVLVFHRHNLRLRTWNPVILDGMEWASQLPQIIKPDQELPLPQCSRAVKQQSLDFRHKEPEAAAIGKAHAQMAYL